MKGICNPTDKCLEAVPWTLTWFISKLGKLDYCSNGNLFIDSCLKISWLILPLLRGLGFFLVDSSPMDLNLLSQFSIAWATCDSFKDKKHFVDSLFSNSHCHDNYSCVFFSFNLWLATTWYNLINENCHVLGITVAGALTTSSITTAFGLWDPLMQARPSDSLLCKPPSLTSPVALCKWESGCWVALLDCACSSGSYRPGHCFVSSKGVQSREGTRLRSL